MKGNDQQKQDAREMMVQLIKPMSSIQYQTPAVRRGGRCCFQGSGLRELSRTAYRGWQRQTIRR